MGKAFGDGSWEIGFDVRYWFLAGQLLYVDMLKGWILQQESPLRGSFQGDGRSANSKQ